jgi:hypothetical protein
VVADFDLADGDDCPIGEYYACAWGEGLAGLAVGSFFVGDFLFGEFFLFGGGAFGACACCESGAGFEGEDACISDLAYAGDEGEGGTGANVNRGPMMSITRCAVECDTSNNGQIWRVVRFVCQYVATSDMRSARSRRH